jgi:hypothetical protein
MVRLAGRSDRAGHRPALLRVCCSIFTMEQTLED